jgi:phenol 2-monooxygenase (NADPH)
MPELLFPKKGRYGLRDYEKAFCALEDGRQNIFAMRNVNRDVGCLVFVRPDQYVAQVLPLNEVAALVKFFSSFMLKIQ